MPRNTLSLAVLACIPKLLGVPRLWTNLNVSSDVLSYTISNTGIIITARRVFTTSVASVTWGDWPFEQSAPQVHLPTNVIRN